MRSFILLSVGLLMLSAAMPVSTAQTSRPASRSPELPESARPSDYLRAAQSALVAGRTGEAREALEMAQTRMLDRSVPLGQTNDASSNPTVGQIAATRQALAVGDRAASLRLLQTAIETATAQGL